jgi:16S rRNA G966 N2-methylase RsmD
MVGHQEQLFSVNQEYQDLIPPLTAQEYEGLKDSIQNGVQKIPIVVSNRTGILIIVEGHHRYKACRELGIEPKYNIRHFESEAEEIEFIRDCNLERRQLNTFKKGVIVLRTKNKLAEIAKKNSQDNLKQNIKDNTNTNAELPSVKHLTVGRVNEKLGKKVGMSHETLQKIEKILKEAPQNIIDKCMKDQYSVNKAFIRLQNEQKRQELINTRSVINLPDNKNVQLLLGDFKEKGKDIPNNSIPLIFTDPPYAEEYLHLYRDLGQLAARVLEPGGSLLTFANYDLPGSIRLLQESGLKYIHIMVVIHTGPCGMDYPNNIRLKKKDLLWFVKGTTPNTSGIVEDVIYSTPPDKSLNEWTQSTVEAEHIIKGLTVGENYNQIVLDPLMGAGTFGIAALKLKRRFIGIEVDEDSFKVAEANISRVV